jgi:hypothetical protein
MWKPEGTSWGQVVEHDKILLGCDTSVISFLCLYYIGARNERVVLVHAFSISET